MLLVTGATGHTGRYFIDELIQNKYEGKIRCVVRSHSNIEMLVKSGLNIEFCYGDINDEDFINKAMNGISIVFHIYNIHHSPQIIKRAISNGVKRVILVHTTGIYSKFKNASSEYNRIESEVLTQSKSKIDLTILRPTMIYGDMCDHNMSKFIKMIDKMKVYPIINGGNNLIQPVNARDLGKAYYQVLLNSEITNNKQYNLSGEKPIPLREVLNLISTKLGKKTTYISVPMSLSVLIARTLKSLTFNRFDIVEKVQRMGEDRAYSNALSKNDFNFSPTSFEEGIDLEVAEYLKNYKCSSKT